MVAVPSISCDTPEYHDLKKVAGVMIVFSVIALPVAVCAFLIHYYFRGEKEVPSTSASKLAATSSQTDIETHDTVPTEIEEDPIIKAQEAKRNRGKTFISPKFTSMFGILTESYGTKRWWYEPSQLLRRLILISIAVTANNRAERDTTLAIFCLVFLAINMRVRPFVRKIENYSESASLFLLVIIAVILVDVGGPLSTGTTAVLFLLIIIPITILVSYLIYMASADVLHQGVHPYLEKRQDHRSRGEIRQFYLDQLKQKNKGDGVEIEGPQKEGQENVEHREDPLVQ